MSVGKCREAELGGGAGSGAGQGTCREEKHWKLVQACEVHGVVKGALIMCSRVGFGVVLGKAYLGVSLVR